MNRKVILWGIIAALFYGFGLLVFHAIADFGGSDPLSSVQVIWGQMYYLWSFIVNALMMAVIVSVNRLLWKMLSPLLIYSILRVCLEIITISTGTDANNSTIVTILYMACFTACIYLSIIHLKEAWKES